MTDAELIVALERMRNTMVAVATGGPRIDDENVAYQTNYANVADALRQRNLPIPPYGSLWDWHGRWSSGDLPTYRSRREFLGEIFNPLLNRIRTGQKASVEPTGWLRVDRVIGEARDRLVAGTDEEHFQAVGLLCREALISVAQAVFVADRHPTLDGVVASETDAKRMLDA